MRVHTFVVCVSLAAVILGAAPRAEGQVVKFSSIRDAVASRYFDPATTAPAPGNANQLNIGFHTTFDSATFKWTNFKASTASFFDRTVSDTISFNITAPTGYYVAKLTYTQTGSGSVVRTGVVSGTAAWVVAGRPTRIGNFSTNANLSQTLDLTSRKLTSVAVSITDTLFAYATPSLGSATLSLTGASVLVQLAPK